jgi:hypothetical protein
MRFFSARSRTAPTTSNPQAAGLIREAQAKCRKCGTDWRLFPTDGLRLTYVHRDKSVCQAPLERQQLRDIAKANRARPA